MSQRVDAEFATTGLIPPHDRELILFVVVPGPMGGSNRALATLLGALGPRVRRVVAAPRRGGFAEFIASRGIVDEWVPLPWTPFVMRKMVRLLAACRLALWCLRRRRSLIGIHANATKALNLVIPAALLTRVPVTVWVHDPAPSKWGRRLGPIIRHLVPDLRWAAVSEVARAAAVANGLCRPEEVAIVPNPIDPAEVVGARSGRSDGLVIGFLGAAMHRKGFDLLPEVIERTADLDVEWRLFTKRNETEFSRPIWDQLEKMQGVRISLPGPDPDVRRVYGQCDLVLVLSRSESFSLVTGEAMLNGIPVVASDLEPHRQLLGNSKGAGLLFGSGDPKAAADALRRLIKDDDLRARMGAEGRRRAERFVPEEVAAAMLAIYGVSA